MTQEQNWTIGKLLEWTTKYLADRGSDSPRLEAEVLLAFAKQCQRIHLYTAFDELASDSVRDTFRNLVKQRAEGVPVAYLVGKKEFYSLNFLVTPDVLIPRPETEFLMIRLLDLIKERQGAESTISIADLGTGSGVLAVCAAHQLPLAQVTAIDVSRAALAVAKQNAELHHVADRITLVESDLLTAIPEEQKFDYIISNPPYVSESEYADLDREVKDYEPRVALVAGPEGISIIERLIPQACARLTPGGTLLFEISPMIALRVQTLLEHRPELSHVRVTKDLAHHPRVLEATRVAN